MSLDPSSHHESGFFSASASHGTWPSTPSPVQSSSFSVSQGSQIRKRESPVREIRHHGGQQRLRYRTVSEMDLPKSVPSSVGEDDMLSPMLSTPGLTFSSFSSLSTPPPGFGATTANHQEDASSGTVINEVSHSGAAADNTMHWGRPDLGADFEDATSMAVYPEPDLSSSTPLVFVAPTSVYTMGTPGFLFPSFFPGDTRSGEPWLGSMNYHDSASAMAPDNASDFPVHPMGRNERPSSVSERVDGEVYTMIAHGPGGMTVACNAHGCRPIWTDDAEYRPSEWMDSNRTAPEGGSAVYPQQPPAYPLRSAECEVGSVCFCSKPMLPRHHLGGSPEEEHKVQEMDDLYRASFEEDPENALFLRNYAKFLYEVKGDYFAADAVFQKAVQVAPADGELLVLYAKFLWEGMCDAEKASLMFQQAVEVSPDNCYVLAAHAAFLWDADSMLEQTSVLAPPFPPPQAVEM
ncbi:hypothetical protein CLOM_g8375 [Closterium sp. NIES-68]|nr:hypothetical protein CLOM_g8375 [Closterium sp. NIES-68]